jgi:hypothetical protein
MEGVISEFKKFPKPERTIRKYLELVFTLWEVKSKHFLKVKEKMPKPNEVWFIFSYKNAEDVVKQFARQSEHSENAWMAIHEKLYEYVRKNNQRSAIWTSQRLQLAINGALKTRILFVSTNSLVMVINSFCDDKRVSGALREFNLNRNWGLKNKAKETFDRTPLMRLLTNNDHPIGKKRSRQTQEALQMAEEPFKRINRMISTKEISDKCLNKAISECINMDGDITSIAEKGHPWLRGIVPDILIEQGEKQICLEFHYTNKDAPGEIAD